MFIFQLAVPLLFGRNVSCPDLRQELEKEKREDQFTKERRILNSELNDSSTDVADLVETSADGNRSTFYLRPPDLSVDLGSMESLLMDDEIASSPTPLKDRCRSSSGESHPSRFNYISN